jgi:hypothetical protein
MQNQSLCSCSSCCGWGTINEQSFTHALSKQNLQYNQGRIRHNEKWCKQNSVHGEIINLEKTPLRSPYYKNIDDSVSNFTLILLLLFCLNKNCKVNIDIMFVKPLDKPRDKHLIPKYSFWCKRKKEIETELNILIKITTSIYS